MKYFGLLMLLIAPVAFSQTSAQLTWVAPSTFTDGSVLDPVTDLSGFGIYRDGVRVGTANGGATTSYTDPVGFGTFEYCVTAIRSGTGVESACSNPASVTKVDDRVPSPPTLLDVIIAFLKRVFGWFA